MDTGHQRAKSDSPSLQGRHGSHPRSPGHTEGSSFDPAGLDIGDGAPQLDDKVIREAESLEVRAVDRFGKVHRVVFVLAELPDLGRWNGE